MLNQADSSFDSQESIWQPHCPRTNPHSKRGLEFILILIRPPQWHQQPPEDSSPQAILKLQPCNSFKSKVRHEPQPFLNCYQNSYLISPLTKTLFLCELEANATAGALINLTYTFVSLDWLSTPKDWWHDYSIAWAFFNTFGAEWDLLRFRFVRAESSFWHHINLKYLGW